MNDETKTGEIVQFLPEDKQRIGESIIAAATESPAEFGKKLMDAVHDRGNKVFMDTILNRANEVVEHLNNLYIAEDRLKAEIALFERRKAAIAAGEISVLRDGRLKYNDILLNY